MPKKTTKKSGSKKTRRETIRVADGELVGYIMKDSGGVAVYDAKKGNKQSSVAAQLKRLFASKSEVRRLRERVEHLEEQLESFGKIISDVTEVSLESQSSWIYSDEEDWRGLLLLPCYIYLGGPQGDTDPYIVEQAMVDFVGSLLPIDRVVGGEPNRGSWYRRVWTRISRFSTSREVKERLALGEQALKEELLEKPAAENVNQRATAAAALIQAVKDEDDAILLMGQLAVVKTTDSDGKTFVRAVCLTAEQMKKLQGETEHLLSPHNFVQLLGT
jgi:hypothetical protein